jgi:hypothetical protein
MESHRLSALRTRRSCAHSELEGRLDWIGGLFVFTESGQQVFTDAGIFFAGITGSPVAPLPLFEQRIDTRSIAGFGQATYQLNDRLSITGGLRYTRRCLPHRIGHSFRGAMRRV